MVDLGRASTNEMLCEMDQWPKQESSSLGFTRLNLDTFRYCIIRGRRVICMYIYLLDCIVACIMHNHAVYGADERESMRHI